MGEPIAVHELILDLRQVQVLRALPPRLLADVARSLDVKWLAPGDPIMEEHAPVRCVSFVLDGCAQWMRDSRVIGSAEPGASIGLLEVLAHSQASAEARAAGPMRIVRLSSDRWVELCEDSFDLVHAVGGAMADQLASGGVYRLGRAACLPSVRGALPRHIDFTDRLVRLRMSRPFVRAPIRALAALAQRCEIVRCGSGTNLWHRGRDARKAMVVLGGEVREGRDLVSAGDTLGLLEALSSRRRENDAVVTSSLTGIVLDVEAILDVLEEDDDFALELLRATADELLAFSSARGLPPDVYGGIPDRSIPRGVAAH